MTYDALINFAHLMDQRLDGEGYLADIGLANGDHVIGATHPPRDRCLQVDRITQAGEREPVFIDFSYIVSITRALD